jgi:hypothetical protein
VFRIAFFSTSFHPYADSQTIRYTQYLSNLNKQIQIDLFVPGDLIDSYRIAKFSDNVNYIYCGTPFFINLINFVSFNNTLNWIFKNIGYYFFFPDQFSGFQKNFNKYFQAEIRKGKKYDLFVTSGGSVVSHLLGLRIKEITGIKWIGEFGDPWYLVDKNEKPWFSFLSKYYEKKIVKNVDHLIFTSEATLKAYRDIFNIGKKGSIIYYGFCENDFVRFKEIKKVSKKIILSHIGASHVADRDLSKIISFITSKQNEIFFELNVIGNHSLSYELQVKENKANNVFFKNRVSFEESIKFMFDSDILILVGNKGNLQIPGKVFHYLATKKPIIYLNQQNLDNDPCWTEVLKKYPLVIPVYNDENEIKANINFERLINLIEKRNNVINEIDSILESFESKTISSQFLELALKK